MNSSNQTQY